MEAFSISITQFLLTVPVSIQFFMFALFSFTEGLPVIGTVLPGGTIAIFAGTLVQEGLLSPVTTSLVIALSSFFGEMTGFLISKKFRHLRWIRAIVENEKHQRKWDLFDRHLAIVTIFGKLIPVVRSAPSILAAVRGIKTRKYILYSFIGSVLWAVVGVYAGKLLDDFFGKKAVFLIFAIFVTSILFVVVRMVIKNLYKKYKKSQDN
jgi:membrane protein DedA with SNARE-associated domain